MNSQSKLIRLPLILAFALLSPLSAALVSWDTSTDPGVQNGNGTWGVDNFWTPWSGGGSGTVLNAWVDGDDAFFGRNNAGAGTPGGDFTVNVSGTQTAASIQQPGGGTGNFMLEGGTINTSSIRADQGLFTVNSDVVGGATTLQMTGGQISLGGNNTFTSTNIIASGTPSLSLTSGGALGSSNTTTVSSQNVTIDVVSSNIASTDLTLANGLVITRLINSGPSSSTWGGNINTGTTAILQAGGLTSQLNINGIISGGVVNVEDGATLRLNGANTHTGNTVVRAGGTLIVGNNSALGTTDSGTFVNANATLNLLGANIGMEAITLQQVNARIQNTAAATTAIASGNIVLQSTGHSIGGAGDLLIDGNLSGAQGFNKVGAGLLTLGGNNTFTGDLTILQGGVTLSNSGDLLFVIGASGSNNRITGVGDLILDGSLTFDLSSAGTNVGDSWSIVDVATLNSLFYDSNFTIAGFTEEGAGMWNFDSGSVVYQFAESSGMLTVIPEPSTYALLFGGLAMVLILVRRRTQIAFR